jgi:hypothetical protein
VGDRIAARAESTSGQMKLSTASDRTDKSLEGVDP